MRVRHNPDGSVEIFASRFQFFKTALISAGLGAMLGYGFERFLGDRFLAFSVIAVFGFWTVRGLVQATFVPQLLTLRFATDHVEGPKLWWLFRERVEWLEVNWEQTRIVAGRLNVLSQDGRQIFTRLSWYGEEESHVIQEHLERYRHAGQFSTMTTASSG